MPIFLARIIAIIGLLALSPIILPVMFLVWWQDKHSPFYIAARTGIDETSFNMIKLRSMVINADKSGVDSTAADDKRITKVGHFIRRYKLDELMQLVNVAKGEMTLVGPRPNVKRETDLYTKVEKRLLSVRPGITDFASIVFSDEGDVLEGKEDPDIAYNQLIRPGKGYLGLAYLDNRSFMMDLKIIFLTIVAIVSRSSALSSLNGVLKSAGVDSATIKLALRDEPLIPMPPPGAAEIVNNREGRVTEL